MSTLARISILIPFFIFSLSTTSKAQASCTNSVSVSTGEHSIPASEDSDFWYSYVMPTDGRLEISSSSTNRVYVYSNTCADQVYEDNGRGGTIITSLSSGETAFIKWNVQDGGDFDWQIAVEDYEPGDNCFTPRNAQLGDNTISLTTLDYIWYSYTMPADGKLTLTSTHSMYIYSASCDEETQIAYRTGDPLSLLDLTAGSKIYIKARTDFTADLTWTLKISDYEIGDSCELAAQAVTYSQTIPVTGNDYYWYKYTMPSTGDLYISVLTPGVLGVAGYRGACNDLMEVDSGTRAYFTSIPKDEVIYIRMLSWGGGDIQWKISHTPVADGSRCEIPLEASLGDLSATYASYTTYNTVWYKYTIPEDGKLQIRSSSENQVAVYESSCEESMDPIADGYENLDISSLSTGDEILIQWHFYVREDFDWNLSMGDLKAGDNCENVIDITLGEHTIENTANTEKWYKMTLPQEGRLNIYSSQNLSGGIYKNSCGNLEPIRYSGHNNFVTGVLEKGTELYIKLRTGAKIPTFTWTATVGYHSGDQCDLAIRVFDDYQSSIQIMHDYAWFLYYLNHAGRIKISSEESVNVTIFEYNCEDLVPLTSGIGNTEYTDPLPIYTPVLIRWSHSDQQISWDIEQFEMHIQTIEFEYIEDKTIEDEPFPVVIGTNSELEIGYTISGPATLANNMVTLTGEVGTVTITASQSGDENNMPVEASISFEVRDFTLNIEAGHNQNTMPTIFPNPVAEELNVFKALDKSTQVQLFLVDLTGNKILEKIIANTANLHTTLNLTSVPAGQYVLTVITADQKFNQKITVIR